ncbi:MAG TPA: response regulator [Pyrinomonadaceae bacterium]|jgi:CheY-like chemotaxis protein
MPARILIADDYDDNRELLRLILEGDGHTIREARNGRECVELAQAEPPDLCLIDLSMPLLDGWGVLRELRADARTREIPCVAVTAFADAGLIRKNVNEDFDAYISKPFRGKDLLETVARMLDERK